MYVQGSFVRLFLVSCALIEWFPLITSYNCCHQNRKWREMFLTKILPQEYVKRVMFHCRLHHPLKSPGMSSRLPTIVNCSPSITSVLRRNRDRAAHHKIPKGWLRLVDLSVHWFPSINNLYFTVSGFSPFILRSQILPLVFCSFYEKVAECHIRTSQKWRIGRVVGFLQLILSMGLM